MAAKEAAALRKVKDAAGDLERAQINRAKAERDARKAMNTKGALTPGTPANEKMIAANERLRKSQLALEKSERSLAALQKSSAQSKAVAAQAAETLRIKTDQLRLAQQRVVAAEAAVKASSAQVAAAHNAQAAAAQRVALASTELAAAEARVVAANNAVAASTARASAAQNAGSSSAQRYGNALGNDIDRGAKRANKSMFDLASRTQWLGRQLQTNFTLPILIAGGFATKFAVENEAAMIRLRKVYGDLSMPQEQITAETEALARNFRELSEIYGVHQKEVIEIGAAWAAAGSSGVALAKSVQETMRTMVLGEISAAEATEALIAIQAQYRLSTDELTDTINKLNIVENQTGTSMKDLIEGMERASGAAASAGIDVDHLIAGMAGLVPAAGSAANAGNALKTIYTRLAAPTHDANQLLEVMGIRIKEQSWLSANAADRLDILSGALEKASTSQQRMAARTLFGIYQISRADILIRALTDDTSYYNRALRALEDPNERLAVAQRELNTILESQPMQLKRLRVVYENIAADIGTQLIPAVIMAGEVIKDLLQGFNDLSPTMQKAVVAAFLFLAAVGPLVRWAAGFVVLLGVLGKGLFGIAGGFARLGGVILAVVAAPFKLLSGVILGSIGAFKAITGAFAAFKASGIKASAAIRLIMTRVGFFLLGWPAMLTAALVAGIIIFKDQIGQAFSAVNSAVGDNLSMFAGAFAPIVSFFNKAVDAIVSVFHKLPQGIQSAMMAVVNIVYQAVMAVYDLFSYLNPFARHSPSLVENVTQGMAIVRDEFASITSISDPINKAYADIEKFKRATAEFKGSLDTFKRAEDLKDLLSIAPGASDEFLALVRDLQKMEPVVSRLEASMNRQQRVVDAWEAKLDKLNAKLDKQKNKLEDLQDVADKWAEKLQAAQERLSDFASTPLRGLGAMEDQIFANTQAQKALQLQMMEMEDAVGPMDDLKNRLSKLAGEIEVLRGEQTSLREAGAGSDILAVYDEQINALEQQQSAINNTSSQYNQLQDQLEALQRAGQKLDLQKSLNFDGLQRDIQKAADAITEMPFDEIMAGIRGAQADIALYGDKVDQANQRVREQQQVVDGLQDRYDAMKARYDVEKQALDEITAKYNKWRDAAEAVKSALDDVGQAAAEALEKGMKKKKGGGGGALDPAVQDFLDAAGGNFDIPLGTGVGPGREGGMGDQSSMIDDLTAKLRDKQKEMADKLDVFKPLRDQWNKFTSWWSTKVTPGLTKMWDDLKTGMGDIDWGAPFKSAEGQDTKLTKTFKAIGGGLKSLWALLGPEVTARFSLFFEKGKKAFDELMPVFVDLGKALFNLWKAVQPLVMLIGGILLFAIKVLASTVTGVLGPALDAIIFIISGVIQVITGIINVFSGILLNDWGILWDGVKQIFQGAWDLIKGFFNSTIGTLIGAVKGFVQGIIGFFQWLYDILVGHSIIPDMINAIIRWFTGMPGKILAAIVGLGQKLWDWAKAAWDKVLSALQTAWTATWNWLKSVPGKIFDTLTGAYELMKSAGSKIINAVKDGFVGAWNAVSKWVGDKVTWIVDKLTGIRDSLAGKFTGMFDGIKDAFRSAINFLIRGWNSLSFGIPGFDPPGPGPKFGGINIGVPKIPELYRGGRAYAGMPHIIGERGPEFFTPNTSGMVTSNNDISELMVRAVETALSNLAGIGAAGTFRSTSPAKLGVIAGAADRRIAAATAGDSTLAGRTVVNQHNEYHFHGDLSFPNIKSGEDAEMFLTNLSDLAG